MTISTLLTPNQADSRRGYASGFALDAANTDLYSQFASEFVGNWWYLDASGSHVSAPVSLTVTGTPGASTIPLQDSSGTKTAPGIHVPNTNTIHWDTGAVASPAGDFSVVWVGLLDADTTHALIAKDDASPNRGLFFGAVSTGAYCEFSSNGTGVTATLGPDGTTYPVSARCPLVLVLTFKANGTARYYVNGVEGATGTPGASLYNNSTTPWSVGFRANISQTMTGSTIVAFMTEKELSAATVLAMTRAILPEVTLGKGGPLTTTRTTRLALPRSDGYVQTRLPKQVGYLGGVQNWQVKTNLVKSSDNLASADWNVLGAPTRTANYGYGPDGSKTTTRIQIGAVGAGESKCVYHQPALNPVSGQVHTLSFFARATSGTTTLPWYRRSAGVIEGGLQQTLLTTTAQRVSVTFTTTSASYDLIFGNIYADTTTATSACDVEMWGVQLEQGILTPPILTAGATAQRAIDNISIPTTGWPTAKGQITFDFTPAWSVSAGGSNPELTYRTLFDGQSALGGLSMTFVSGTDQIQVNCGATPNFFITNQAAWTKGATYKMKLTWSGTTVSVFRDGVSLGSNVNAGNAFSAWQANCYLGTSDGASYGVNGTISNFKVQSL